jgi:hypothetical protein
LILLLCGGIAWETRKPMRPRPLAILRHRHRPRMRSPSLREGSPLKSYPRKDGISPLRRFRTATLACTRGRTIAPGFHRAHALAVSRLPCASPY